MARRRILVPVDFSTQSDLALEYARSMASSLDAMISCIYVIEEQGKVTDKTTGNEIKHKLRRDAENKLSERVNLILNNDKKVSFELIVTSGTAHQKVLEKSIDLNVLMIIIGRSNSSLKRTKKIGSNARKIISRSLVPVIVVNKQTLGKHKHLIFPVDLETPFSEKLPRVIEIALVLGAFVSVIAVIEKERASFRPVYLKKLREIDRLLNEQNVLCDTQLIENQTTISSEIHKFSGRIEAGIILLMTRQESKSDRPYLGVMEEEVLVRTDEPVLFLNPRNTVRLFLSNSNQLAHPASPSGVQLEDQFI
jgi:nucleotide-binding universal stress UspA family protein